MSIMLVLPPGFAVHQPPLSLPLLTAFLKGRGYKVIQRDANLDLYFDLLSCASLRGIVKKGQAQERELSGRSRLSRKDKFRLNELRTVLGWSNDLLPQIDQALSTSASKDLKQEDNEQINALVIVSRAMKMISVILSPFYIEFSGIGFMGYSPCSSNDVLALVKDKGLNPLIDYYRTKLLPEIRRTSPRLLGISIFSSDQLISGLTLARMAKRSLPGCHVMIGGGLISSLASQIASHKGLMALADSFCRYEGEKPLLRLVEALRQGRDIQEVPNLFYWQNGRARFNEVCQPVGIDSLPTPDFTGLPLDRYITPEVVLPQLATRGRCYWSKCAFCDGYKVHSGGSQFRSARKVVQDLHQLARKHRMRFFNLNGECLPPARVRAICQELIEKKRSFFWDLPIRAEKGFSRELLDLMYRAGVRAVYFGLESASQRVLDLMQKGVSMKEAKRIVRQCQEIGVLVYASAFIGFPGENKNEAMTTIKFINRSQEIRDSASLQTFMLLEGAPIHLRPSSSIDKIFPARKKLDLASVREYTVLRGLSHEQAEQILGQNLKLAESGFIPGYLKFLKFSRRLERR